MVETGTFFSTGRSWGQGEGADKESESPGALRRGLRSTSYRRAVVSGVDLEVPTVDPKAQQLSQTALKGQQEDRDKPGSPVSPASPVSAKPASPGKNKVGTLAVAHTEYSDMHNMLYTARFTELHCKGEQLEHIFDLKSNYLGAACCLQHRAIHAVCLLSQHS